MVKIAKRSPLQIDGFYKGNNLAVEYQGEQHYKYIPHWHKSKTDFEYRQECDKLKKEQIRSRGITLLLVKYNEPTTRQYLTNRLKGLDYDKKREHQKCNSTD